MMYKAILIGICMILLVGCTDYDVQCLDTVADTVCKEKGYDSGNAQKNMFGLNKLLNGNAIIVCSENLPCDFRNFDCIATRQHQLRYSSEEIELCTVNTD